MTWLEVTRKIILFHSMDSRQGRSRLKEAYLLAFRPSLWIDIVIVAVVMLIELFGVYIAGGIIYEAPPLRDPFREWIGEWYAISHRIFDFPVS